MEHIIQEEKVNINRDAIEALLKMGRGDMRRVVAYPQEITFESLFLVTEIRANTSTRLPVTK